MKTYIVKSIVQPKFVYNCSNAHYCQYVHGKYAVCENGEHCYKNMSLKVSVDKIRINHYWTRTEDYFNNYKIPIYEKKEAKEMGCVA